MPNENPLPAALNADEALKDLDPPRLALVRRMRECGLNYAALSRQIGRNQTYVHQYITKKAPRVLPEVERLKLAELLEIPEHQLREHVPNFEVWRSIATKRTSSPPQTPAGIPVFSEGDEINFSKPAEWTPRPSFINADGKGFALWVARSHGRLRPGDMAYVRLGQPPRIGDTVVVVAGAQMVAIGDLTAAGADTFAVDGTDYPSDAHRALKVVGVMFG